ncbi:MAG: hypothetical protein V4721_16515 [Bacteroidota bacterium]
MTEYIHIVIPDNWESPSILKAYRSRRTAFRIAGEEGARTKKVELIEKKFDGSIRVPKKRKRLGNQKKSRSGRKK